MGGNTFMSTSLQFGQLKIQNPSTLNMTVKLLTEHHLEFLSFKGGIKGPF